MQKEGLPFRQIHLDFHTSPLIDEIGARFDRESFVQTLKKAHVNSINLFTKCHHGMYYYPTKLGMMHPNLHFDLFGEQLKACRENDIRALAYTCVAWNEACAKLHPEWLMVNAEGIVGNKKPFECGYYQWNTLCYNNKSYQKLLKEELQEIYELYHPDGFWIDIVQGKGCVCSTCSGEMRALGLHPESQEDRTKFDKLSETAFCREFYQYLKSLNADLEVYFNAFPYELDNGENKALSSVEKRKYFDFVDIESLPSDQWGYTHFTVAANYLNKYDKDICMMNGKFHTAWGDFGSLRHKNALEYECLRAVANGARVCIGDQLHPRGELDAPVYERIGEVFEKIEKLEPWLIGTKKLSEIGVLIPTKVGITETNDSGATEEGVYRILSELHLLFDFVNAEDSLDKYALLVLPDCVELSASTVCKINDYVTRGGKLLITGSAGFQDGKPLFPSMELCHHGKSAFDVQYLRLNKDIFSHIPTIDHVVYEAGESVTGTGEVLAEIVNPYFERNHLHFCSHRQTPPDLDPSGEIGVIQCTGGIYVNFPIFRLYTEYGYTIYRDVLKVCIDRLLEEPYLKTDLPTITELTLRKSGEDYVLHMLNYVIARKAKILDTIEEKFTVCNKELMVKTNQPPKSVKKIPELTEIRCEFTDGYTCIPIACEEGYSGYCIEM